MRDTVRKYLMEEGIEYFSILEYSACRELRPHLISREGIEARSVIIYLLPYFSVEGENISSYAVGIDYHLVTRRINRELTERLSQKFGGNKFIGFGDHSPIDERHAALISGLGIRGDSGLLINEKYGTYVFIGEIVTDLEASRDDLTPLTEEKRCIGCGKCKVACPTGILRGEGDDCLSAITQKKGELSEYEIDLMTEYNTAWGCDICQRVCPYNNAPKKTDVSDFLSDTVSHLTSSILGGMDEPEFERRAYAWRGRKTIMRNLEILENANKDLQKQ